MKFKKWMKRNKEGAILGALWGGISGFFWFFEFSLAGSSGHAVQTVTLMHKVLMLPGIIASYGVNLFGGSGAVAGGIFSTFIGMPLALIIGATIGAFIDSKWRPKK